ncbi:nuclear receptor coactivator-like [Tropilaelaps mercedesae]|uniref:Nuclear receptor coactivator-like n=1 Tax=Tropilaelaps mercedesae TaxID=418985 RepID=A0A1V9X8I5_9ACAR|nr:nuclear receptor coactivator-like [Tropilaelaps mercedesae]
MSIQGGGGTGPSNSLGGALSSLQGLGSGHGPHAHPGGQQGPHGTMMPLGAAPLAVQGPMGVQQQIQSQHHQQQQQQQQMVVHQQQQQQQLKRGAGRRRASDNQAVSTGAGPPTGVGGVGPALASSAADGSASRMLVASLGGGPSIGHGGTHGGLMGIQGGGPLAGGSTTTGMMSCANSASVASTQGSQVKKCLNEKLRREQASIYLEELAELISNVSAEYGGAPVGGGGPGDVGGARTLAVKPDKCAILQETVNHIRRLQNDSESLGGSSQHELSLQGNQVSSSKANILCSDILGPMVLDALDAFFLVINSAGNVDFVSENCSMFVGYEPSDLESKNIYSLVHPADRARFSSNLLPTQSNDAQQLLNPQKTRSFFCRFIAKSSINDQHSGIDSEQGHNIVALPNSHSHGTYVNMHISAILTPVSGGGTNAPQGNCLLCFVRRLPVNELLPQAGGSSNDGKKALPAIAACSTMASNIGSVEQFTTRLDPCGRVLTIDLTGLSAGYATLLKHGVPEGRLLRDACDTRADQERLNDHLKQTSLAGAHTSSVYVLRPGGPDSPSIHVQTKSKKFTPPARSSEKEFVNAVHSIIKDAPSTHSDDLALPPRSLTPLGAIVGPSPTSNSNQSNTTSSNVTGVKTPVSTQQGNASIALGGGVPPKPPTPGTPGTHLAGVPLTGLVCNDGNNNSQQGAAGGNVFNMAGIGSSSEKLRNLLIQGKSGCNSSSSTSIGQQQPNTILKQLLNSSGESGHDQVVIKQEHKLGVILSRKVSVKLRRHLRRPASLSLLKTRHASKDDADLMAVRMESTVFTNSWRAFLYANLRSVFVCSSWHVADVSTETMKSASCLSYRWKFIELLTGSMLSQLSCPSLFVFDHSQNDDPKLTRSFPLLVLKTVLFICAKCEIIVAALACVVSHQVEPFSLSHPLN